MLLGGAAALLAAGGAAWLLAARPEPPPGNPDDPPLATAEAIAARRGGDGLAIFRLASNPAIWVFDFPDLAAQGEAFNRAAAFFEKASAPRDRVLADAELAAAIAADGHTADNYYFGHNYRASELRRFFAAADAQGVALNRAERRVREALARAARLHPGGAEVAVLGIPGVGGEVDGPMRESILRHELGHGEFFTRPDLAARVMAVWRDGFAEPEREAFRRFLSAAGYDSAQEELAANEAFAFLLHTPDPRFFDPGRDVGWGAAQAEALRARLRAAVGAAAAAGRAPGARR